MDGFTFEYALFSLNILILLLQCFGTYLMYKLYHNGHDSISLMYFINLSVLETLKNIVSILSFPIIDILELKGQSESVVEIIQAFVGTIGDGFNLIHYFFISYVSIDRFLEVWLSIKYPIYWNQKKAKYLLVITWILPISLFTCLFISEEVMQDDLLYPYTIYLYVTLDVIVVMIFVVTNGYIYQQYYARKIKGPDRSKARLSTTRTRKISVFHVLSKSTFFMSSLLILNYISLRVIPDFVYLIIGVIPGNKNYKLLLGVLIMVTLSDLIDACIYVFTVQTVKETIRKQLQQLTKYVRSYLFNTSTSYFPRQQEEQLSNVLETIENNATSVIE